jgi:hypothetical protein
MRSSAQAFQRSLPKLMIGERELAAAIKLPSFKRKQSSKQNRS